MRTTGMLVLQVRHSAEFTCTEGVWMSVTPTDDELIVVLDFEGLADFLWSFLN